jgi:hypothetical protein
MKRVVGNHVGIVVNVSDPENRGRVQVFVPHISTTLYNNWNEKLKDIKFKTFEDSVFDSQTKERLLSLLPWAEAAVPVWGGGTGAPINTDTGTPVPFPTDQAFTYKGATADYNKLFASGKSDYGLSENMKSSLGGFAANFPNAVITSGKRDYVPEGGSQTSLHLSGNAIDVAMPASPVEQERMVNWWMTQGGATEIGWEGNHIHVGFRQDGNKSVFWRNSPSEAVNTNLAGSPSWFQNLGSQFKGGSLQRYAQAPKTNEAVTGKADPREWEKTGLESKDGNMDPSAVPVASRASDLAQLNPNIVRGLYGLGMAETGFSRNEASSNANNQLQTITDGGKTISVKNSNVFKEYNKNGGDLAAAQAKYGDYGYFQVNAMNNTQAGTSLNTGTASEQMVKTADYIKKINPNAYSALETGDYTRAYGLLQGTWPSLNPNVSTNNLDKAYAAVNTDMGQIIKNVENAGTITPPDPSSGDKLFRTTNQGLLATGSYNAGRIGGPSGMFSCPAVGAKVWVFFQAENPQRPVYFANVYEPSNANAAGVPS